MMTLSVTRCTCCSGRKTVLGLGGLLKPCRECRGVGYVTVAAPDVASVDVVVDIDKRSKEYREFKKNKGD